MFNSVLEISATVFDVVFMVWFVSNFNHRRFDEERLALIFPLCVLVFQLVCEEILETFSFLYSFGSIVLTLAYSMIICRRKFTRAVLSTCLYHASMMLVGSLSTSAFTLFIKDPNSIIMGSVSINRAIYLIIGKILQFVVLKLFLQIFNANDRFDFKNSLICLLFHLISTVGLGALLDIVTEANNQDIYIPIFITISVIALSNVAFYIMIYQIQKLLKQKYELKLMQERMEFEASKIEEANAVWNNIRKVRHDIKNHLIVISAQLDGGMVEECKEYVKKITPSVDNIGNLIRTNNPVMDYMINSKLSRLNDVNVKITGCMEKMDDIEDIDIACIMGNILDNAVEAQSNVCGEKRIEVIFMLKDGIRLIVCKNTVSSSVLKNNKYLRTYKKNPENHGIGHKIVESAVSKYNGAVDYFEEDGMFGVQIMLPEKIL